MQIDSNDDVSIGEMMDALDDVPSLNAKCLESTTIVLTGEFESISRDRLQGMIVDMGGRVTSAVSGKTNILVHGYKLEDGREVHEGSKYVKAKQMGTKIMSEKEF